jgi:hypothetical protein
MLKNAAEQAIPKGKGNTFATAILNTQENVEVISKETTSSEPISAINRIRATNSAHSNVELKSVIDQIFILCETGVASTIQFLLESYVELQDLINEKRVCDISSTLIELTPLQLSAACGHQEVVRLFLSYPSTNINIVDPANIMTALHLAVWLNQNQVVEELCSCTKLDLSIKNVNGKTALHLATEFFFANRFERRRRNRRKQRSSLCGIQSESKNYANFVEVCFIQKLLCV